MKPSDLKRSIRALGTEPDDFPGCNDKTELVKLYRQISIKKLTEKTDLQKHKELMAMSPQVGYVLNVI